MANAKIFSRGGASLPRAVRGDGAWITDAEGRRYLDAAGGAMTADELMAAQRLVRRLPVGESVVDAILALVRSARPGPGSATS